ncbi:MAG: hypothetical protein EBZ60_03005, partial [Betaproteobacteria bacterium]|nr:hypothetical protein [Betaproteobacteria bacterium]
MTHHSLQSSLVHQSGRWLLKSLGAMVALLVLVFSGNTGKEQAPVAGNPVSGVDKSAPTVTGSLVCRRFYDTRP